MLCLHFYITITPPPPTPTTNTQLTHSQIRRTFARFVYIFSHFNLKWFHFAFLLSHVSARLDALRLALFFILQGANSLYFAGA